jgi:oxepin-CoA hydrolase/3-oxo-5,6-dehydrosuberyl-CoA semialdehyde dehydrogenase
MNFIELDLENVLKILNNLSAETKPNWGKMNAQQMIEHLTIGIKMSTGKVSYPFEVDEEIMSKMKAFLYTDKPMKKDIAVAFAKENPELINEELELAIDEFVIEWIDFEEYYELNPNTTNSHPYYGNLTYEEWCLLHKKHFTHHFDQFGLL